MSSIFTRIVNGEIPAHVVGEDEHFIAFLDINPLVQGHTLVVPKEEIDYLFDLDDSLLTSLIVFSKKVALRMDQVFDCARIGVSVIGLEVPHAHVHLIPMNSVSDMDFSKPKLSLSQEKMEEIAARINSVK